MNVKECLKKLSDLVVTTMMGAESSEGSGETQKSFLADGLALMCAHKAIDHARVEKEKIWEENNGFRDIVFNVPTKGTADFIRYETFREILDEFTEEEMNEDVNIDDTNAILNKFLEDVENEQSREEKTRT